MWTVSALQQHQRACVGKQCSWCSPAQASGLGAYQWLLFQTKLKVCDEDATLELKVKTVKYFKGIQETQEKVLGIPMEGYAGRVVREASPMLLLLLLLLA